MVRVRVRQHVNPLSHKYQTAIVPPNWQQIYANLSQPWHLDIGCARGRFVLEMAQLQPQINFLGLEIREALVTEAKEIRDQLGLTNLHYLFANINYQPELLLASLPPESLHYVTIQFPDPWFKKRHSKRRVSQPELFAQLANYLVTGGIIFLQSDIEELAKEMRNLCQANPHFQLKHSEFWLETNPFSIPTEREKATLAKGEPVYRALFMKK